LGVYLTIPTTYLSNSVLVLTIPTTGGSLPTNPLIPHGLTNPLLNFDHGLSVSASILIAALGTPETAAELGVSPDGTTTYKVYNGSSNLESLSTGPLVFIEGEGRTPEAAAEMVRRVIERTRDVLAERQRRLDAPRATFIKLDEMVPPTTPMAQRGRKMRSAAAAAGLGVIASLFVTFAAESFLSARSARRRPVPPAEQPFFDEDLVHIGSAPGRRP
jgi:hypothetical protein